MLSSATQRQDQRHTCTMIERSSPLLASSQGNELNEFARYCSTYRQRIDAIQLIRQLNQLARLVQRHRGVSMAILAGSTLFYDDYRTLQQQLARRMAYLSEFSARNGNLLAEKDRAGLYSAWRTVSADWQDDDVIDNFELHSHFIEQLQSITAALGATLETPVSAEVADSVTLAVTDADPADAPQLFKQVEVLRFALHQAPEMLEQVARIRGLSTYAAAKGVCDEHHDRKLRYAISCARSANEKLRHQAERLTGILGGALPCLALLRSYELKLAFLISKVEAEVLSGGEITSDSHSLFKLATDIIDVYLQVVDEAVALTERWHQDDLEAWLRQVDS